MTSNTAFPRFVPPPVPALDARPAPPVAEAGPDEPAAPVLEPPVDLTTRPRPNFPRPRIGSTRGAA